MTHLNICIIETGASHPTMAERYGRYPHMIAQWLQPVLPNAHFRIVSVFEGESIDLDHHEDDGFIVTGSPHGVYDDLPWIQPLKEQLREIANRGLPLLGICFGHQIMAAAFGGEVKKSHKGWGIGIQHYEFDTPELAADDVLVYHQDQVVKAPAQAQVIGGSEHCPIGALQYPFAARSIQFHPEFSNEFVAALIKFRNDPIDDREEQLQALATQQMNNHLYAQWAADFFQQHRKEPTAH
ncbi:MAG TPA: gamma-glutamyl-gamma-aminobutyrate hydrolase family protein [Paenalcaligenes sp.]|nr:gamma-glutamyl-gamma-aminobutyrate hydrolase family protein [Paenalcaligenes sp.]